MRDVRTIPVVLLAALGTAGRVQTPPQPPPALLAQDALQYEGAFRLPAPTGRGEMNTFGYGGAALGFDAERQSLWVTGHDWHQRIAEVSIPTPARGTEVGKLPRAEMRTSWIDTVWRTRIGADAGGAKIGGIFPLADGSKVVSAYVYYDAGGRQELSHFRLAASGEAIGPVRVGSFGAGFVAGYMTSIPPEWQKALGGTALTGQSLIPIISRTSLGPAAAVFTPAELVGTRPVRATQILGYPLDHPTLGTCETGREINCSTKIQAMVFPSGTQSVLFIGRHGTGPLCYKNEGPKSCWGTGGWHAPPYKTRVWAYDVNDLIGVKNGRRRPWSIRPYATWDLGAPLEDEQILAAAYDPATQRVFLSQYHGDGTQPLIRVYQVRLAAQHPSSP